MKFSIVIPTQDRAHLLAVVVEHAMQLRHTDFEVIVSDNSTTDEHVRLNKNAVFAHIDAPNFRIVRPPRVLSPPEHFEFALRAASESTYVVYLTDKMVVLPHALADMERAIEAVDADIVNWGYATYFLDDVKNPKGSGTLAKEAALLQGHAGIFDPDTALRFKASGETPRNRQQARDYVLGKIVFGCYRRSLIDKILKTSGTLFCGATHDYSAMIQALALAKKCVMLDACNFLFLSLPSNQSLGSLTDIDSQAALKYFRSFSDADAILSELMVPGLYSSQHNMVAHDYKKFLPLYGKERYFNTTNWLLAIYSDLLSEAKIWSSDEERRVQLKLFFDYLDESGQKEVVIRRWEAANRSRLRQKRRNRVVAAVRARTPTILRKIFDKPEKPQYYSAAASSLQDAIRDIMESTPEVALGKLGRLPRE